nr:phosphatase PAP2 family protein [Bacillus cereus]
MTLCLYKKRLGKAFVFLAFLIAFSRVWVGVHYLLNVLIGGVLGSMWAFIIHYIVKTNFNNN